MLHALILPYFVNVALVIVALMLSCLMLHYLMSHYLMLNFTFSCSLFLVIPKAACGEVYAPLKSHVPPFLCAPFVCVRENVFGDVTRSWKLKPSHNFFCQGKLILNRYYLCILKFSVAFIFLYKFWSVNCDRPDILYAINTVGINYYLKLDQRLVLRFWYCATALC